MKGRTAYQVKGKDLLLVYKRELMILGESAWDSLRKQKLYFDDHKGDIKKSLLMKFQLAFSRSSLVVARDLPATVTVFFIRVFKSSFRVTSLLFLSLIMLVTHTQYRQM